MLLSDVFSDMFSDMITTPMIGRGDAAHPQGLMSCDVHEFDDRYVIEMDLAGFRKGDIKADLKNGYLTIKAERSASNDTQKDGRVIRSERFMGACQRTFYVGDHVKQEDVKAAFEDGVLKLSIPKAVEQPKVDDGHYIEIH